MYYLFVIKSEEAELTKLHKSEFEIYLKKVPRFLPKSSLMNEPEKYLVRPIVIRRHMFDALWFIWFLGVFKLIETFRELKVLPTIFKIY
ncbi:MAG: hypothetical protein C0611_05585 [Desulfobacteraceae bacterium]|nr:MAG: hypothetical protein C0611_05585 [Desulfobacteraceae bacterium]